MLARPHYPPVPTPVRYARRIRSVLGHTGGLAALARIEGLIRYRAVPRKRDTGQTLHGSPRSGKAKKQIESADYIDQALILLKTLGNAS